MSKHVNHFLIGITSYIGNSKLSSNKQKQIWIQQRLGLMDTSLFRYYSIRNELDTATCKSLADWHRSLHREE